MSKRLSNKDMALFRATKRSAERIKDLKQGIEYKKKLDNIKKRGRELSKKIRKNRNRLKGEELKLYNNLIEAVIKYLKESAFWIEKNNLELADEMMGNAEKHWSMNIK